MVPLFTPDMRFARSMQPYTKAQIDPYLPANYEAFRVLSDDGPYLLLVGKDHAGWTLDGYVIPRLASGLYWFEEVSVGEAGPFLPAPDPSCVVCGYALPDDGELVCGEGCAREMGEQIFADLYEDEIQEVLF